MSDIFREVEEDVRREKMEKLWKQYGDYVIAAAVVLVVGVAGFKFWQHYHTTQLAKASASYMKAMEAVQGGKGKDAIIALGQIAKSAPSGYAKTASLAQAGQLLEDGKSGEAIALYKKIAADDSGEIGKVARIRAAWAMAEKSSSTDLTDWLAPLNTEKSGWRYMAQEILAYVDYRDGKLKEAGEAYAKLENDPKVPGTISQRAKAMSSLIKTGPGTYGTVPLPETAKPATDTETATPTGNKK